MNPAAPPGLENLEGHLVPGLTPLGYGSIAPFGAVGRPFRAWVVGVMTYSEGVALGCGSSPRWGFGIASLILRNMSYSSLCVVNSAIFKCNYQQFYG